MRDRLAAGVAALGRVRLGQLLQRDQVEETAACARALTALFGKVPEVDVLPGGASRIPRAVLTGRILQDLPACPWPSSLMRQTDPDDAAFLPPLGLHPVLAARDCTVLGLPDRGRQAWVDPLGWCGVGDGPSVAVWFGDAQGLWPVGRRPDEQGGRGDASVEQSRGEGGVGVVTRCRRGALSLRLSCFPMVVDGQVAWALETDLQHDSETPLAVRLAFALRPAGIDGIAPVFQLERDDAGLWTADGSPLLAVAQRGDQCLTGVHGQPDPWLRLTGQVPSKASTAARAQTVRCPVGLASGVELTNATLQPGQRLTRLAVLAPPAATTRALAQTSAASLRAGAHADRAGLLRSGCELQLARHQGVLDAARQRLLVADSRVDLGGMLGSIALARLGFQRRAGDRIAAGLSKVRRDGSLADAQGPETAAVLAWAAAEHLRWTDARTVARATRMSWVRLVDRLVETPPEAGGFSLFGTRGSRRWTALWRAAALVACAAALRDRGEMVRSDDLTRWGLAGAAACEELDDWLGDGPWTSDRDRVPDGSSAAMLTAVWLGVVSPDHRGVAPTVQALRERHWHGGGVLLQGGAHLAATSLLVAAEERRQPGFEHIDTVARLASPTGALPTARHPARGAVGHGDDMLSAALFVLLACERVHAGGGVLRILPGVVSARGLPTPYGPVDIDGDRIVGHWWGRAPAVERLGATLGE